MNADQIALVRETFAKVAPISETAADLFYDRLFEIAPEVRELFPSDLSGQKKKLMQMLGTVIGSLTRLEAIMPAVEELARRHNDYRVEPEHYDLVGAALLWTLEKGLGDAFTAEVKDAWASVYAALSDAMKKAAYA